MMKLAIVIWPAILSLALAGCDSASTPDCNSVVIGAGLPLSGGSNRTGNNVLQAITLAVEDANADGGVRGVNVVIRTVDDQSGTDETVVKNAANTLALDQCVLAVVGHLNSAATLWAQEVYNRAGVVNFTPASTASSIAANSKWTFRDITHNGYKGQFLADFAKNELGLGRVGIIYDEDAFGSDLEGFFANEANSIGLEIVGTFSYSRSTPSDQLKTQISSDVASLLTAGAQSVYASGVLNEGVMVVNAVRAQAGADMPIIWSGWEEPLLIQDAGANAEGVYVPIHRIYDDQNPAAAAFKQRYQDRFGEAPDAFAPFAYDATSMLIEAVRSAGRNRVSIRTWLSGIDTSGEAYQGVTGPIYFDATGDIKEHFISALVVRNGQFVPYGD